MLFNRFGEYIPNPSFFMLPQMFFLILMTASFDTEFSHTYITFLTGYLSIRAFTVLQYYFTSKKLQGNEKEVAELLGKTLSVGVAVPFLSIFLTGELHYVIMYAGIFTDMLLPVFFREKLSEVPVNLSHLAERFGLFVIIAFGESLVSVTSILKDDLTDLPTLYFSITGFVIISMLWASYFYAHENVIDRYRKTNGQIMLYGHFFVLISIMILAGCLEMLYANILPVKVLLGLFYGSLILFYFSAHYIFYFHRKKEDSYYKMENFAAPVLFLLAYLANYLYAATILSNLILAAFICAIILLVQRRSYKDLIVSDKQ